jgi:hypothetical protein
MEELKQNYKEARANIIKAIDAFPIERREEILFDKWNLHQLLSHLNGWDEFLTKAIRSLESDAKEDFPATADGVNVDTLGKRGSMSWDEVYKEFGDSGMTIFNELDNLSEEDWNRPLWSNNDMSTKDFLNILIDHINNEHLPLVKKFI